MITIRFATGDDAGLIADLSRKTFSETFGYLNTKANMDKFMSTTFSREKLMAEVGDPDNIFLLAYEDETPVGYAKMTEGKTHPAFEGKDNIEIARIYVVNTSLGTGVGKELMRKCIFLSKEMKKELVWLGVWEKNPRAIAFYEKWGFEKFDEHDFVLGDDVQRDWLLKRTI